MALLGLFHKKDKQKPSRSNTPSKAETSAASVSDATSIAETEYVSVNHSTAPYSSHNGFYNGPAAASTSTSKLNFGFSRKKSIPQINIDDLPAFRPPQIPYSPTSRSEANVNQIRPPPSKASLFGGYAESDGALSTRSLPTKPISHSRSNSQETNITDVPASISNHNSAKKSGGLFAWAHRDRKKSKPSEPLPELKVDLGSDSFNLRSFRHIGAESPHSIDVPRPTSSLSPTYMTPPARPRPRENSVNSDSSQRVSVAAFREMAARTRNNTPSPSLRPPSSVDLSSPSHLRPPLTTRPGQTRNSTARALSSATSSDSSESEESESDDSTGSATLRPNRDNTITKRSTKASTELGHRTTRTTPSPGQSRPRLSVGQSDSAQIGRGNGNQVMSRPRASASTSALHPNAAAKRASLRAASATQPPLPVVAPSRRKTADSDSDASTSSDSEDSDDAPLAKFVIPRRPGSSASNATTSSRPRAPSKPLIDITAMTTPPIPSLTSSPSDQSPSPPEKEKEEEKTRPTHSSKPSLGDRLARLAQNVNTKSIENLSDVSPIGRRSLDARPMLEPERERGRTPPSRSQTAPLGTLDSSTSSPLATLTISPPSPSAARKINRRSLSSPNAAVFDLTDTTPIVPTPIRERSPPPAFSVTSRPISTFSQSSKDALTSNQNTPQTTHSSPQDIAHTQPQHTHTTSTSTIRVVTSPPSSPPVVRLSHALHQPSSPAAASFMSTSSSGATLTVPGASEPILRNPPPRSSSRQSTLVPNNGAKPTDGFTGGGLLSTPAADPATHKKPEMPSYARGGMSNSPPSQTRNGRTRSSTMEPKLESHPHRYAESLAPSSARKASNVETMSTKTVPTPPRISTSSVTTTPPSSTSRPRSSTMNHIPSPSSGLPPPKPFATKSAMRGNSPASSTGDSSSGRTPLTPADGSDIGHNGKHGGSSGVSVSGSSGLSHPASAISRKKAPGEGHRKRPSVTFDDVSDKEMRNDEERRKERRRSEAKAAIELGKVVNGQISLDDDDEDEDAPLNPSMGPRMSMVNPMMNFTPATPIAWRPPSSVMGSPMSAQSFSMFPMPPPNADPAFLVAHQQAMMVAKQAYQYAVAQQAMAQANEEWERGSTATSAYGGFGGGMGMGGMGGMNMNPMGMPMGGMFGNPYAMGMQGWPGGGMMFPSSAQSMYAGSVIGGSEMNFGGGGGGGGWGSKSEYGGPTSNRNSAMLRQRQESHAPSSQSVVGGASSSQQQNRPGPRPRTKTAPSSRQAPPPSSWKASPQRPL